MRGIPARSFQGKIPVPQAAVVRGRQRHGGTGSGEGTAMVSLSTGRRDLPSSGVPDGPSWEWRWISAALGLGMK